MKKSLVESWNALMKLVRFLVWYAAGVSLVFYLLPIAGLVLEVQYESLSNSTRFFAVIGFFAVVVAWQVVSIRDRWRGRA